MATERTGIPATFLDAWRVRRDAHRVSAEQLHRRVREVHAASARAIAEAREICREIQIDRLRRWTGLK